VFRGLYSVTCERRPNLHSFGQVFSRDGGALLRGTAANGAADLPYRSRRTLSQSLTTSGMVPAPEADGRDGRVPSRWPARDTPR
jgi:hypothetical protein